VRLPVQRRFEHEDDSRNSLTLALIILGEGWHNNHHRYPASERQGYYWWEIDISHYLITCLSKLGLVWDVKEPPSSIYERAPRLCLGRLTEDIKDFYGAAAKLPPDQ